MSRECAHKVCKPSLVLSHCLVSEDPKHCTAPIIARRGGVVYDHCFESSTTTSTITPEIETTNRELDSRAPDAASRSHRVGQPNIRAGPSESRNFPASATTNHLRSFFSPPHHHTTATLPNCDSTLHVTLIASPTPATTTHRLSHHIPPDQILAIAQQTLIVIP